MDGLAQLILDTIMNEKERNNQQRYHPKGYKILDICSCSSCHIAHMLSQAIRERMKIDEVVLANMIIGYSNLDTTEADNLARSLILNVKELIKW